MRDLRPAGDQLLGARLQHGRQQRLPGGEVPVQRGGPDTRLLGHRLQRGTDAFVQEVTLRRFQESRTIALDVRTGLTPLLSLVAHTPACLLRSVGPRKTEADSVWVRE
ncbi:hypothetical protein GCM10010304_63840 [Streptomyces roseoviolaceus]